MEFYPNTFDIDAETREVQTQLQGKKVAPDTQINIRGVLCAQSGSVREFDCPAFKLVRYGEGYKVQWDREITEDVSLLLEAQGMGLIVRTPILLRDGEKAEAAAVAAAAPEGAPDNTPAPQTPHQKYKTLVAMGVDEVDALAVIKNKLGDDAEAQVKAAVLAEITG